MKPCIFRLPAAAAIVCGCLASAQTLAQNLTTLVSFNGTVKLAESRLGQSRVGRLNGRDDNGSRPDLRRLSLPR